MIYRLSAIACCALLFAGCAVPSHMQVDNTMHPKHEDKDVRFRATYYFRVFDDCSDKTKRQVDTLYRFRMTGKAQSLTTQVRFESGTLTASQIDPLGAAVAYDEKNRQFYFKSQGESKLEAQRNHHLDDLGRLLALGGQKGALESMLTSKTLEPTEAAELRKVLRDVIAQRIGSLKDPVPAQAKAAKLTGTGQTEGSDVCQNARRGFLILGPEGARTFNQDERLLLAMSTSGKPLISTMQELAGRVLNNQATDAEKMLPLVREDLRISRALRELDKFSGESPERGAILLGSAISQLGDEEPQK